MFCKNVVYSFFLCAGSDLLKESFGYWSRKNMSFVKRFQPINAHRTFKKNFINRIIYVVAKKMARNGHKTDIYHSQIYGKQSPVFCY